MRWLLLKDLQILRRSPLLVGLLVAYPILIAVLIGLALSGGPDKPKVAFVNLVPPEKNRISLGGQVLDASRYASKLFEAVDEADRIERARLPFQCNAPVGEVHARQHDVGNRG